MAEQPTLAPERPRRVLKVAPGEDAKLWDDCLAHGYIRVGWEELGDLRGYASRDDVRRRFSELYPTLYNGNSATVGRIVNSLWTYRHLEPGDQIVANRGLTEVL